MADPLLLSTAAAAAVVGFSSSLHCFLMCGPLACAAATHEPRRLAPVLGYQLGRLGAYGLVGGLLGALGGGATALLRTSLLPVAPWILVATLLVAALDLGSRLPAVPGLAQTMRRVARWTQNLPRAARAIALGALTPLLPCGLLYGVFAASLAAGSFGAGALALSAFGAGAVPALLVSQLPAGALLRGQGPAARMARRVIPALAAVVVAARALFWSGAAVCH
ncbi:MAG TPA: sulfite exporter TauE/SafE family protein [Myxococcaceae bacterium]|nr:sulfite exporter TauE/SafE family protein [Myxococcaceae bacterium]